MPGRIKAIPRNASLGGREPKRAPLPRYLDGRTRRKLARRKTSIPMYTQVTHPNARLYCGRNPVRSSGAEEPFRLSDTFPGERRGLEVGDQGRGDVRDPVRSGHAAG